MADVPVIRDDPNIQNINEIEKDDDRLEILSSIINDRFEILKRLGSGSFGEVFLAKDTTTNLLCAIKTERSDAKHPQLRIEQQIFSRMKNCKGYPSMIALIEEKGFIVLAMDLLGPSLEDLLNFCQRKFSKKTVLMLMDQAFIHIQHMHERYLIHRDLKPDNFLMGTGEKANILHVIDFGLCKQYRDPITYVHISLVHGKSLTGTARYASLYTHQGYEQSRRDDLESLIYILIYLSKGELPWMGIKASDKRKKYELIAMKKLNITSEELFRNLPKQYKTIYDYIRSLTFNEKPDYAYIRCQIRSIFLKYNYKYDYIYDWYRVARRMKNVLDEQE
ncbi:unnamed protein product [Rotaria socialis]|uniref:non-specific serine/threonine protein kinase n=1 Tax=Rotaria socialis TaxID=392032 RepID=A0A818WAG5_9BILA|nr:unnamed protein product [Rotaria socialis]CAF3327187.1 unnamed protein product [Rotaria socialis]CAF3723093.1 unnamed protein product [Rotaria socialis]CAF4233325.1 unnamed protein product [Rotaria socialis]CAF4378534.1 unnamed protein product [Rotaria socialis]